jgi:hypothetical protein
MQRRKTILYLTIMIILVLQACNLPSDAATEEPTIDPMLAAGLTLTAAAELNTPMEALPTFTPLPSLTSTPVFTNTPNLTPTPTFAYLTLSTATNCRGGASTDFGIVDTFNIGQTIEVVGKHPFDNYWYVRSPNNPAVYCWMWGFYATGANLNNVPVLTPPPTPTSAPQPDFSSSYVNSGQCVVPVNSWWSRVNITNTGPIALKSIAMTIKDTVSSETKNSSKDGFQDVNSCLLQPINSVLDPAESATVVTPSLAGDPTGHKVELTLKLCTETGQAGICVTKTIEFTP